MYCNTEVRTPPAGQRKPNKGATQISWTLKDCLVECKDLFTAVDIRLRLAENDQLRPLYETILPALDKFAIVVCEEANVSTRGMPVDEENDKLTLRPLKSDMGSDLFGILVRRFQNYLRPSEYLILLWIIHYVGLLGRLQLRVAGEAPFDRTALCVAELVAGADDGHEVLSKSDATWRRLSSMARICWPSFQRFVKALITRDRPPLTAAELGDFVSFVCASGYLADSSPKLEPVTVYGVERWLTVVARFCHVEVVRCISATSVVQRSPRRRSNEQLAARRLLLACASCEKPLVDLLFAKHPELNPNEASDADGMLALHHAVRNGSEALIIELLEYGADVAARDRYGRNVLHHAAAAKQQLAMEVVIEKARDKGQLKELLNQQDFFYGSDVYGGDVHLKRYKLRSYHSTSKANAVHKPRFGVTVGSGSGWNAGSDVRQRNRAGQERLSDGQLSDLTPLHLAVLQPSAPLTRRLLEEGADPKAVDHFGCTAAHYAAMTGSAECLELLLSKGADLTAQNNDGLTPADVARYSDQVELMRMVDVLLVEHSVQTFLHSVDQYTEKLKADVLQGHRYRGQNLRLYVIEQIRDLQININILLFDLDLHLLKAM